MKRIIPLLLVRRSFSVGGNRPVYSLRVLLPSAFICGSKSLLLGVVCLLVVNTTSAELQWKKTSQIIPVHPLQASVVVPFEFTNAGDEAVTILDLKPSCGCITGNIDRKTYAPGEAGTVSVTFNLQGRVGAQHKGLSVKTDDTPSKPTQLYIDTTIPETYNPSVQRVTWQSGEEHGSKTVHLANASKTPFPLEKAVPSSDGISVELKTIREGFEYDLVITPAADLHKTLIPVVIHPKMPAGLDSVKTYTVYALVK